MILFLYCLRGYMVLFALIEIQIFKLIAFYVESIEYNIEYPKNNWKIYLFNITSKLLVGRGCF